MCRLACNVCSVTTKNGSSIGSSSCCRLSTRCSLSVVSPGQQVSLHSFGYCTCSVWTTISLSSYLSVLAAIASLQQLTTSSFCPEALLCFFCYTVSHRLASMGVRSAATCLGEHTISPTLCFVVLAVLLRILNDNMVVHRTKNEYGKRCEKGTQEGYEANKNPGKFPIK